MIKYAVVTLMLSSLSVANASSFHTCPKVGFTSAPLLAKPGRLGDEQWKIYLPKGEIEMFVKGSTIFCKYQGMMMTKEVGEHCVLGAAGGKIVTQYDDSYCTFTDELGSKNPDCFVTCP